MTEQLRDIIEKAIAARQPASGAERAAVYDGVRQRLGRYIDERSPSLAEDRRSRLLAALESTISEVEGRFSANTPSPPQRPNHGVTDMTTSPISEPQASKSSKTAVLAALGAAVVAVAGGAWWWSQSGGISCTVDGATVTPTRLHNVAESPEGFLVSGADPQIVLSVPTSGAGLRTCIALTIDSEKADVLEIFLPDPNSATEGFAAGRSITQKLDAGMNEIRLELPDHAKGRMIRVDPVGGATRSIVSTIQFGKI